MRGVELALRREIIRDEPDHPRADEEYYKLSLGKLERLQVPIPAGKWKRVTFLYTTGELFARAGIINDLVVRSEERKILWHSLCEKARESELYKSGDALEFELTPDILMMLGELHLDGKG